MYEGANPSLTKWGIPKKVPLKSTVRLTAWKDRHFLTTKIDNMTKKKTSKAPATLFGEMIRHNPKAHKLSVALNMSGIGVDIPTADLILRVFDKMNEMGGKFDLQTACDIRSQMEEEYDKVQNRFKTKKN